MLEVLTFTDGRGGARQDSLAVFRHLLSFHDAELAAHLDDVGFLPELYAIPWFLTLYTRTDHRAAAGRVAVAIVPGAGGPTHPTGRVEAGRPELGCGARGADVFPMDKIFHLFDQLLVGPPSLPLYVGIAILRQLRGTLLAAGFNESIMIFSDMPDVDISLCLQQVQTGTSRASARADDRPTSRASVDVLRRRPRLLAAGPVHGSADAAVARAPRPRQARQVKRGRAGKCRASDIATDLHGVAGPSSQTRHAPAPGRRSSLSPGGPQTRPWWEKPVRVTLVAAQSSGRWCVLVLEGSVHLTVASPPGRLGVRGRRGRGRP